MAKGIVAKEKEIAKEEKLKMFIIMFKNTPNLDLDKLEKEQIINFSEIDVNKVISIWGNKDEDKLKLLKEYLGKKRSIGSK